MYKHYIVCAAIIIKDKQILCLQRNKSKYDYISYKYEFPGGKVEHSENEEDALIREIKEELNIDLSIVEKFLIVEHAYPDFAITMHSFLCHANVDKLTLKEHINMKWLKATELSSLDWAAADLPIVSKLMQTEYAIF